MDRETRFVLLIISIWTIFTIVFLFALIQNQSSSNVCPSITKSPQITLVQSDGHLTTFDRSSRLIFIGGFPRSGTTLVRAMLDVHSAIRCGQETRVIPRILELAHAARNTTPNLDLTMNTLDDAVGGFILQIIAKHGEPADRLCNKDPFSIKRGKILLEIFPNAKFIYMIRDGRAVVHSLIKRNVSVTGFNLKDPEQCLRKWSNVSSNFLAQCNAIGSDRCLKVRYESLVLNPKSQLERILKYLDVPWEDAVLHHEEFIGQPGGVYLSKMEKSTDQVKKALNSEPVDKWVGHFVRPILEDMENIAPMLWEFGYNPWENPPNYNTLGKFDPLIQN